MTEHKGLTFAVYIFAIIRIVLCMFPQNEWLSAHAPLSWGIYRNIPFALLGLLVIVLFFQSSQQKNDHSFRYMWLTIVLSFAFYIPVVLFVGCINPLGTLTNVPSISKKAIFVSIIKTSYAFFHILIFFRNYQNFVYNRLRRFLLWIQK